MRIVIALGDNGLLQRGGPMTIENQRASVAGLAASLEPVIAEHDLVISHGNGPQLGLLAMQAAAYDEVMAYPFDVLGAQTDGMIGYLIEQEVRNHCPQSRPVATVMTMTEVDLSDPAFAAPSAFVGPPYSYETAAGLVEASGWTVAPDGDVWRRTVPSPAPLRVLELRAIEWLLDHRAIVVCAGGGGIPVAWEHATGRLVGVEAVVDKDRTSAVLARALEADLLVLATDAEGVFDGWGTQTARCIRSVHPDDLRVADYPAASMAPKVEAAIAFAKGGRGSAVIGSLSDLAAMVEGTAGTRVSATAGAKLYWADEFVGR